MKLIGTIKLRGDKSISHRALLIASTIKDDSIIKNISLCEDVKTTINSLNMCGITIVNKNDKFIVSGGVLSKPTDVINLNNSGTTARLLLGLLAGHGIAADFIGDKSLSVRPMDRIIKPLQMMGAIIKSNNNYLPIKLISGVTKNISYTKNSESAQIKSSLMFAAMNMNEESKILYNQCTRDHTERLMRCLNKNSFRKDQKYISIKKSIIDKGFDICIPGDLSNAAFIIAGAVLLKDSNVIIKNVLYNKTRMGFIDLLIKMGADIKIKNIKNVSGGENVCDLRVKYAGKLIAENIDIDNIIPLVDEIPVLSIIGTQIKGKITIRNAKELKYKESDRISAVYTNLLKMGANINLIKDGFVISGGKKLYNTNIDCHNDHRVAMSFDILNLFINNKFKNYSKGLSQISFPEFKDIITELMK